MLVFKLNLGLKPPSVDGVPASKGLTSLITCEGRAAEVPTGVELSELVAAPRSLALLALISSSSSNRLSLSLKSSRFLFNCSRSSLGLLFDHGVALHKASTAEYPNR